MYTLKNIYIRYQDEINKAGGILSLHICIYAFLVATYVQHKGKQSETNVYLNATAISKATLGQGNGFEMNKDEKHCGFMFYLLLFSKHLIAEAR